MIWVFSLADKELLSYDRYSPHVILYLLHIWKIIHLRKDIYSPRVTLFDYFGNVHGHTATSSCGGSG